MSDDTKKLVKSAVITLIGIAAGLATQYLTTGSVDWTAVATGVSAWLANFGKVKAGL